MPSPETNIVQAVTKAVQYTGSNSADIIAQFNGLSFVDEVDGVLTVSFNGNTIILNTTDWMTQNPFVTSSLSHGQYLVEWGCVVLCDELETLAATVSEIGAQASLGSVRAVGIAVVPSLDPSDTADVDIQLQPAMPDSSYSAYASKFAGVSLADLHINSVTVVDSDTVTVAVENVGVATITGASIMVHAVD